MDLAEHKVSGKTIFNGKIVRLDVDQARLPDGSIATREVVYHPGGVAILALDEQNNVSLVRQFRYPFGKLLLELPAGKLDHGTEEDPLVGAKRELSEEAGLEAAHWTYLGCILASPGFSSEVLHMYLARQLTPPPRPPAGGRGPPPPRPRAGRGGGAGAPGTRTRTSFWTCSPCPLRSCSPR